MTRWNDFAWDVSRSFHAFDEIRREMDRMREAQDSPARAKHGPMISPRATLTDEGSALVLSVDVPGFQKEDLDIQIEPGSLTVRGHRRVEAPEGYTVHRQERSASRFARTFALTTRLDMENVTATLKNGVLEMRLPKAAEAQARQIEVKAA